MIDFLSLWALFFILAAVVVYLWHRSSTSTTQNQPARPDTRPRGKTWRGEEWAGGHLNTTENQLEPEEEAPQPSRWVDRHASAETHDLSKRTKKRNG